MKQTTTPIDGAENIITVQPKHPLILNEVSDKSLTERVKIKIGLNCTYENIKSTNNGSLLC